MSKMLSDKLNTKLRKDGFVILDRLIRSRGQLLEGMEPTVGKSDPLSEDLIISTNNQLQVMCNKWASEIPIQKFNYIELREFYKEAENTIRVFNKYIADSIAILNECKVLILKEEVNKIFVEFKAV